MSIVVFVTASNRQEAEKIAGKLVENKLAACVNLLDNISSVFWWQGRVHRAKEILLMIKSKKSRLPRIIKLVQSLHSYEVPEIIALPIIGGEKKYLRWIDESIGKSS